MSSTAPLCVFTDLDGTLLDHETYHWTAAAPALAALAAVNAPVILSSSKTAAEIVPLQIEMGLGNFPAIVENGAGVIGLAGFENGNGRAYRQIRSVLEAVPHQLRTGFRGFGDMTAQQVTQVTGLSTEASARAKDRAFSEPGMWNGSNPDRDAFLAVLSAQSITARQGGRFLTLSFGATKADRMTQITQALNARTTLALGDAPNDVEMLEAADQGVIIPNPAGTPLPQLAGERAGKITRAALPGPAGWNQSVLAALEHLNLMTESPLHG